MKYVVIQENQTKRAHLSRQTKVFTANSRYCLVREYEKRKRCGRCMNRKIIVMKFYVIEVDNMEFHFKADEVAISEEEVDCYDQYPSNARADFGGTARIKDFSQLRNNPDPEAIRLASQIVRM